MARVIIGAVAAAIAMFIIGFIFFATPLYKIGTASLDNAQAAAVQQALAANLPGTGTYFVPGAETPQQTVMYGQGPIATIHYNVGGFSVADPGAIIGGLALNFVVALLIGFGLLAVARRVPDFASRARLAVCFAVATAAFVHLGEPIWYHHDWSHSIYVFVADALALAAAGLVIARWFLPRATAPEGAPTDV
ncbi:MAG TPA: hypothetical protein VGE84_05075 [Allosphingosinicella sp.]